MRDNPATAFEEYDRILDDDDPGLNAKLTFDVNDDVSRVFRGSAKPKVAVLREQGVNSQYEMAAALMRAGFSAVDVPLRDLLEGTGTRNSRELSLDPLSEDAASELIRTLLRGAAVRVQTGDEDAKVFAPTDPAVLLGNMERQSAETFQQAHSKLDQLQRG